MTPPSEVKNIAHINQNTGELQSLEDHLRGVSELSGEFASKMGLRSTGRLIGLLHDLGKASADFNTYISTPDSGFSRGQIDHSTAGAQYLYRRKPCPPQDSMFEVCASEMMESAIASHHSGLIDFIGIDGENNYERRLTKNEVETHYDESLSRLDGNLIQEIDEIRAEAIIELADEIKKIIQETSKDDEKRMKLGLLNRFLLSCLVDADCIDTMEFFDGNRRETLKTDWALLAGKLDDYIRSLSDADEISNIRHTVSEECRAAASRDTGVFTLTVPTGGGKTLAGFRFALNHLMTHDMDRVIFVVPYLSIIEQNVAVVRRALGLKDGDNLVTECHSNVDVCEEGSEDEAWIYGVDSWDRPIIFTSMVQFLETLFSSGTKRARRMHNLSRSVIIFDEIQSLPIKTVYMFNVAVSFLTKYCGATTVLCTATQPLLNGSSIDHRLEFDSESEIVSDVSGLFESLERTTVRCVNPDGAPVGADYISDLSVEQIRKVDSVLVIVNTKRMAREVFEKVRCSVDSEVFHLSTNMCAVHRQKVLDDVKNILGHGKIICVSTQLIEAGVDVDFDTVIRSMAGLDSIAQAAGRCNRNARRKTGDVLVVRTNENVGSLPDIEIGRSCAGIVFNRHPDDPLSPEAISEYFESYFYKRRKEMNYCTRNPEASLFSMLSTNTAAVRLCEEHGPVHCVMKQAFHEANANFKVIDSSGSLVVPYDEMARDAIRRLCSDPDINTMKECLRRLQRYTVSTYSVNDMINRGVAKELIEGSGIVCLAEGYYREDVGLCGEPDLDVMMFRGGSNGECY